MHSHASLAAQTVQKKSRAKSPGPPKASCAQPATVIDAAWMHLQAKTEVPLTCQRCLKTVEQALAVDRSFRFVKDEATAEAQDDASEEDLLVISKDFDLLALVEDELLMALPLVPMHTSCQSEHAPTSKDDSDADAGAKPNPFAVLATMRLGKE